jgi:UDP-N-acetyl-D-galactosamine dehydrogenase
MNLILRPADTQTVEVAPLLEPRAIAVIGLGYVGLPLAVALGRHYDVLGFDIDAERVDALRRGRDRTREVDGGELATTTASFTADAASLPGSDLFIITVPTPVEHGNRPDLSAVRAACGAVGRHLRRGAVVVLESTVYPGVTEEVCGPELARHSGLKPGVDFFLGYSPERMNPGDREHALDRVTKVVAGQTPEVADLLARVYGKVASSVFVARDIRTAEAAKVIENAQRDINIAFINEVAQIFNRMGISIHDVLDAARTKWNFLDFVPGLVGGHCIGVDPYYLSYKAQVIGHNPAVILAGRQINDGMGAYIAGRIHAALAQGPAKILVLGLTFKENVPDLRNSRVVDIIRTLEQLGHHVTVHDPFADHAEARAAYRISLVPDLNAVGGFDAIVGTVPHAPYTELGAQDFARLLAPGGLVADVKGMWRNAPVPCGLQRWQL